MKSNAIKKFRAKLAADIPVFGIWVTLESPAITEMAVAMGLDWVVIDAEHSHLDWKEIVAHIRAAVRSDTVVIVRVVERDTGLVKRALDVGADGVAAPWINTAEDLQALIHDSRYPPEGRRGVGGDRATVWGQCFVEHTQEANEHVLVLPNIEHVDVVDEMHQMCQLDGAELFFFGPADFSATAGHVGQWEGPGVAEKILTLKDTMRQTGKHAGVIATSIEDLHLRLEQGFRMIALGTDMGMMMGSLHRVLAAVGLDRKPAPSFDPEEGQAIVEALSFPPDNMQPDREEAITAVGDNDQIEIQRGVIFNPLVGGFNSARNLTTGMVTFQPEASLDYHTHPCSESITVLEGAIEVLVEGRAYRLGVLDNIVIPRWLPHAVRNRSTSAIAKLHITLPTSVVERDLVLRQFSYQSMADDTTGTMGAERVNRHRTARRYSAGPGTKFIDFFNAKLMPGIEMSGGWGQFRSQGRLPAHVHDFDESICIIDGTATCRVGGQEYSMSDCATAMVPRGQVHYFINENTELMSMIWVYAGPMPIRIVVDEQCMTGMVKL
mgnify:CR=1 FL=1